MFLSSSLAAHPLTRTVMTQSNSRYILSLNAGSSSLKISLYSQDQTQQNLSEPVSLVLTSSISNISAPPAQFSFKLEGPTDDSSHNIKDETSDAITDHESAFRHFLELLESQASIDRKRITYICHRVVHGGGYSQSILITDESYHTLEMLSDLAPLHNGAALSVIKACITALPETKSIAHFDTTFHSTIPLHISSCAIDQQIAKKRGLKKYGFHGLSYSFILRSVSRFLNKPPDDLNLIILHLGSGASACAVKNGKSWDTSMGLTPLNGLPGATRSGSIDPSLIFHYTNKAGRITHDPKMATNVHVTMAEDILNRKSGWKSITGTADFGVITAHAQLDDPDPAIAARNPNRLAFDLFADRIMLYIGGYHLKLGGNIDALVFSGGIGERSVELRDVLSERVACLGYCKLDEERNKDVGNIKGVVVDISSEEKAPRYIKGKRILVCRTDEQIEMARQCALDPRFWEEKDEER